MTKILLGVVAALSLTSPNPDAVQAQKTAEETARLLRFPHPVVVLIEPKAVMPRPTLLGYATRYGRTCIVHLETEALRSRGARLIYHEVCHCVLEYERIGEWGYTDDPSDSEMGLREISALACEIQTLKRGERK